MRFLRQWLADLLNLNVEKLCKQVPASVTVQTVVSETS